MKVSDLRNLADWHEDQAKACEFLAVNHELAGSQLSAVAMRERAQWHSSTAILLREHAAAFQEAFPVSSQLFQ